MQQSKHEQVGGKYTIHARMNHIKIHCYHIT
jgi:hypothetical protein